jgi:hypothetical protein
MLENCTMRIFILSKSSRRWTGNVADVGQDEYIFLVRNPEGKKPLGRPSRKWDDNMKLDLKEIGWVWTGFIWLRTGPSGALL